jgi:hypothetical protein
MYLFSKRLALVAVLSTGFLGAAAAQSVTQGAISGTVEDPTSAVVPNASVVITNKGTRATVRLTSDAKGYFNAPLLQPGEYNVTITANGFASYVADHVQVEVSQVTSLLPHLNAEGTTSTVTVEAVAPDINTESPDFSDVITNRVIENVPENNRRWSSLALLTPGVVSDSNGFGLVSIRGISPILNNVEIDGADDNQAYFAEERGRTREAYSTSEDSVREFQVNTGVYSAEFGRAAGGVINSVTKSGTNAFHGELYGYDRESNWSAFTPLATNAVLNPATGTYTNVPIKPKDLRKIYGFAAGGAIIKDKLFWYYTFDEHRHIFPGIARPSNPTAFYTLPDAVLPSTQTCNLATGLDTGTGTNLFYDQQACALAAREGQATYAAGAASYIAGIASLTTDLGSVPRVGDQEINTPKLDFQITPKERLSLLGHRLRWDSPGGVQTAATATYSVDAFGNDFVKLDYGLAKLESELTSTISNELGYQYSRELDYETQQPISAYTQANLSSTTATGTNYNYVALATGTSGFNLGSPYYSYRTAYPDERKWQVFDTAYYVKGNNTFKFGVDILHNYDLINNTYESNGAYSYTYIGNYLADQYSHANGKTNASCNSGASQTATVNATTGVVTSAVGTLPCYSSYVQGYGAPQFDDDTLDYGFFAQDNWKFSPRLTLELGLRYDYEQLPNPNANLTQASGTFVPYTGLANRPSDKNNFGPRIGFAYDLYGNGKSVIRGGYGLYYGRINNGTILNVFLNTGSPNGQYTTTYNQTTAGHPLLPNLASGGATAPAAPSSFFFAKNFQNPEVQEYDLIAQQEIGHGNTLSVSYLASQGRQLPNFLNLNLNPATVKNTTVTFTGGGPVPAGTKITVPTYTGYGNTALFGAGASAFQSITEVISNINSSYNALVAEFKTQSYHGLQADASFTWSHSLDYTQNASTSTSTNNFYDPYSNPRANYGNSNYNVPNRATGYVLYDFPNVKGHDYLKYVANNWSFNDDFQLQSGLPYSVNLSGRNSSQAILTGLNGAGGVSYIPSDVLNAPGLGRNTLKLKRDIVDDIRLVKGIPFSERYVLELRGDFFNIANHQNISTVGTTAYTFSATGTAGNTSNAVYQPNTFGVPVTVNSSGFLYTPRNIQISARFTF